ncbi:hypothetical protein IMSAGC018_01891 [Lachnospiraceae bacterium]|nr:hypothetical protein IMSAGC018_01891 [Lachnospiraceae bacterium]
MRDTGRYRYTEYQAGVPVIQDRALWTEAIKKLARQEELSAQNDESEGRKGR